MDHATKVLSMQEDELEIQEVVEVVTTAKLIIEVIAAISEQQKRGVVIRDPEEESSTNTPTETKSKDKGKGISYDDIYLIFEANFNANMEFLLKSKEQMEKKRAEQLQSLTRLQLRKQQRGED
nr:hypothetical protein [Tanacetum cinerariifolium]